MSLIFHSIVQELYAFFCLTKLKFYYTTYIIYKGFLMALNSVSTKTWQASKMARNHLGGMVIYPFRLFFPKSLNLYIRGHSNVSPSQKGPCLILILFLLQLCVSQHFIYHFHCVCIVCCTNEPMFLAVAGFNSYFRSCGGTQNKQNATQKRRNVCQTQFYKLL